MAFARRGDADPQEGITTLNNDLLHIFVNFYWLLHQGGDKAAGPFLQCERKKRGYESFVYNVSGSTQITEIKKEPECRSVPPKPRKKNVPSQHIAIAAKKELLWRGVQDRHCNEPPPASTVDYMAAPGLSQTKSTLAGGPKISRRSKRGRLGHTYKLGDSSLLDQPHGRSVVQTRTNPTLSETGATTGVPPHVLSKSPEPFDHPEILAPSVCQPSLSQSQSLPPETSSSQTSEAVYLLPDENLFIPAFSVANGKHPPFAQILHRDERGQDEMLKFDSTVIHTQADDTIPMKIEAPIVDIYRSKPPLDKFPPIWAQVIQLLNVLIGSYLPKLVSSGSLRIL